MSSESLMIGKLYRRGCRLYSICATCRSFVWLNKPLLGSIHVCAVDRLAATEEATT